MKLLILFLLVFLVVVGVFMNQKSDVSAPSPGSSIQAPENTVTAIPVPPTHEPTELEKAEAAKKQMLAELVVVDDKWEDGGIGVLFLTLTMRNDSMWDVQDIEIKVGRYGASGTLINTSEHVVYETLNADESKQFTKINCGFMPSQASRFSVRITDCKATNRRFYDSKFAREIQREQLAASRRAAARDAASSSAKQADARLLKWHQEQAEKGSPSAQCSLGLRYLHGDGVPQDETLARAWLQKAASQSHPEALAALAKLPQTRREPSNGRSFFRHGMGGEAVRTAKSHA